MPNGEDRDQVEEAAGKTNPFALIGSGLHCLILSFLLGEATKPAPTRSAFYLFASATRSDEEAKHPGERAGRIAKILWTRFNRRLSAEERAEWIERSRLDRDRHRREMVDYNSNEVSPATVKRRRRELRLVSRSWRNTLLSGGSMKPLPEITSADRAVLGAEGREGAKLDAERTDPFALVSLDVHRLILSFLLQEAAKPRRAMSAFMFFAASIRSEVWGSNPGMNLGGIGKVIGTRFKELSAEENAEWNEKTLQDRERYRREMESYVVNSPNVIKQRRRALSLVSTSWRNAVE